MAVFFVILDRLFKMMAIKGLFEQPVQILGNIFTLSFAKNYYIAFSLPVSGLWLNVLIGVIIFSLIYYWLILNKKRQYDLLVLLTFIIFGAISNWVDRLKYGYVIDYFDLQYFTVFNLADAMIVCGIAFLIYRFYFTNENQNV